MKKRLFLALLMALAMPFAANAQNTRFITQNAAGCGSYTWAVNQATYTADTLVTAVVGDTVYVLNLTIHPQYLTPAVVEVAGVCSYRFGNRTFYTDTICTDTLRTRVGQCDSVVELHLTTANQVAGSYEVVNCGPYIWPASRDTLSTSGVYNHTRVDSLSMGGGRYKRCDSVLTLTLNVLDPIQKEGHKYIEGCDRVTYRFRAVEPQEMAFYADTVVNSDARYPRTHNAWKYYHGRGNTPEQCFDTVSYVHVTVKHSTVHSLTPTACDQYVFDTVARTYTKEIDYIDTLVTPFDTIYRVDTTVTPIHRVWTYTVKNQKFYIDVNAEGCSDSIYLDITVFPSPQCWIDGDINLNPGNQGTTLIAMCDQTVAYSWFKNGQNANVSSDTLATQALSENTDYMLVVKNNSTQCNDTAMVTVTVNEGIGTLAGPAISLYPNPTASILSIDTDEELANVTIYNTLGQRVFNSYSNSRTLNLSALSNGTYTVRIETKSGSVAVRNIVVSR